MDLLEAENRLRALSLITEAATDADKSSRLRSEVNSILGKVPRAEQAAFLKGLAERFPSWPPDVPPPPPPTDEQLLDMLKERSERSVADRQRIEGLMRDRNLGSGFTKDEIGHINQTLSADPDSTPVVARVVEAFVTIATAMDELDTVSRRFLQEYGLGIMAGGAPAGFRSCMLRMITLPDSAPNRHAELARLEAACGLLTRIAEVMSGWPPEFVDMMSAAFAPERVQSVVPAKRFPMSGPDFAGIWNEYVRRLDNQTDEEAYKGKLFDLIQRAMRNAT